MLPARSRRRSSGRARFAPNRHCTSASLASFLSHTTGSGEGDGMAVGAWRNGVLSRFRLALGVGALLAAGAWQGAWGSGTASQPSVLVSQVSTDPVVSAGEAWTVTNPTHPNQVVVIWLGTTGDISHPEALFSGYCGVGRSTDGGRTWQRSKLPLATATTGGTTGELQPAGRRLPICGDPMAGVGPDGTLYGAAVQLGSPSWTQGVTSTDFGAHWTAPYQVFGVNKT